MQNFIKLSAAVQELSCSQNKTATMQKQYCRRDPRAVKRIALTRIIASSTLLTVW